MRDAYEQQDEKRLLIRNACVSAYANGFFGLILTVIGATIRKAHNIDDQATVVFFGGVITGALAGVFDYCISCVKNPSFCTTGAVYLEKTVLGLAAMSTGPLIGEVALNLGTDWREIVSSEFIGGIVLAASIGAASVALTGCLGIVGSFFGRTEVRTQAPTPIRAYDPPSAA